VRGSGDSSGELRVFAHEAEDGAQAVAWAADLPGSSGKVGMYGFSYHGTAQLLALSRAPEALAAIAPAMAGWTIRTDWAYENGAYRLAMGLGWALHLGALAAQRRGDAPAYAALRSAASAPPLGEAVPAKPEILARLGAEHPHRQWIAAPEDGPYWRALAPANLLAGRPAPAPILHIGGWYDLMLTGTLGAFRALGGELLVGPWTHLPWSRLVGAVDFGPEAASFVDDALIAFFDRHLKGETHVAPARVRLFDLGARRWRHGAALPPAETMSFFLKTRGAAGVRQDDGELSPEPGGAGVDRIVHDPWQPAPALGGHAAPLTGVHDRAFIDARFDVLTYTTAPLERRLTIAGDIVLELHVESDAIDFDVDAVLSVVEDDGRVLNIVHAHGRVGDRAAGPFELPMRGTLMTLPAGRRLRLSLAGAAFPAFPVNPGTGAAPADAAASECLPIVIAVRSGGVTPSRLRIAALAEDV